MIGRAKEPKSQRVRFAGQRGLSLIEILSASALISILSVFSVTQYNKSKAKSLTRGAKTQLGHLYNMEKTHFLEHNTYTFDLEGKMFPKGYMLYNVGFWIRSVDYKKNPCATPFGGNFLNNYYELCGDTEDDGRKECWFKNKWGNTLPSGLSYTDISSIRYYIPDHYCGGGSSEDHVPEYAGSTYYCDSATEKLRPEYDSYPENNDKYYKRFIAYAVGDILDPKNFGSNANDLDAWRINGAGYLEHCNDPFNDDHDSVFLCGRNNAMKISEKNNGIYCHGVTPI